MTEQLQQSQQNQPEAPEEKAGIGALVLSFLVPLVGFILCFAMRKKVSNPGAYAIAGGIGMILGAFLRGIAENM